MGIWFLNQKKKVRIKEKKKKHDVEMEISWEPGMKYFFLFFYAPKWGWLLGYILIELTIQSTSNSANTYALAIYSLFVNRFTSYLDKISIGTDSFF